MKMFIECQLPMYLCNMKCQYCYVPQYNKGKAQIPDLTVCENQIEKATSLKRLGGTCMFNICATGETLIHPQLAKIVYSILKNGHYVMIVTNGTLSERLEEYCAFPEEFRKRLFFKISLHYLELSRMNMLDVFCGNIRKIKEHDISYSVELTPDDSYIPYIPAIRDFCVSNFGALCHVTVPRDERKVGYPLMTDLSRKEFVDVWKSFDSTLFDFKESIFEVKRKEFCYAGKWGVVLDLQTGVYRQCYKGLPLGNFYKNTDKPLNLFPIGKNCQEGHCFNGHAFLGFGLIPEINTPAFSEMRNRETASGTQWLNKSMNDFMAEKLKDENNECGSLQKCLMNSLNRAAFASKNFLKKSQ